MSSLLFNYLKPYSIWVENSWSYFLYVFNHIIAFSIVYKLIESTDILILPYYTFTIGERLLTIT